VTRRHLPAILGALLGAAVISYLGLVDFGWNDYAFEAAPAYRALTAGHLHEFFALSPAYSGSLVLRAPFALVAHWLGGGALAVYRAVSLPGVAAMAALAAYAAAQLRAVGQPLLARAAVVGLIAASPVAEHALEVGHPEELLCTALCVGAMLAALGRRAGWAGLLVGLAIAAKAWGLVAVVPVLLAAGPAWRRAAVVAAVTAALVVVPLVAGGVAPANAGRALATTGEIFQPTQLWWFAGETGHVVRGSDGQVKPGYRTPPGWLAGVTHPLIVLLGLTVPLLWLVRRRSRNPGDLLLVLALTLHLRCLLDPWNTDYYALPMLTALAVWEPLVRRRPPALALGLTVVVWLTFRKLNVELAPDAWSAVYLAWAVPLAVALGVQAFAPAVRLTAEAPAPA
jgi:hypothetical protein